MCSVSSCLTNFEKNFCSEPKDISKTSQITAVFFAIITALVVITAVSALFALAPVSFVLLTGTALFMGVVTHDLWKIGSAAEAIGDGVILKAGASIVKGVAKDKDDAFIFTYCQKTILIGPLAAKIKKC